MTDQNKPEDANPEEDASVDPVEPGATTTKDSASEGPTELPYVDDPVSKWWIGIIIAVFALIFAVAILFGAGGLLDGVLNPAEPQETAEPTLVASPSPEPSSSPEASPEASPTVEPTVEPTAAPTPEPTVEPTIGPCPTPNPSASPDMSLSPDMSPLPSQSPGTSPIPCYTPLPEVTQAD